MSTDLVSLVPPGLEPAFEGPIVGGLDDDPEPPPLPLPLPPSATAASSSLTSPRRISGALHPTEARLVQFKLLTQPKVADHHPVPAIPMCLADQNVLRFNIPMDNLQRVQVLQAGRNLLQRALGIKRRLDLLERVGPLDDVRKRGGAEFERYVEEVVLALLVEVPDHVWVVVRFLQDGDLS